MTLVSHDSRTTTNPHNPLCLLQRFDSWQLLSFFTFLYFHLITLQSFHLLGMSSMVSMHIKLCTVHACMAVLHRSISIQCTLNERYMRYFVKHSFYCCLFVFYLPLLPFLELLFSLHFVQPSAFSSLALACAGCARLTPLQNNETARSAAALGTNYILMSVMDVCIST